MGKTLITVQDLSCVGRCSLVVALPVLSCLGVQTYPLPTALLSSHTGFDNPFKKNLTHEMEKIISHWDNILQSVDGVYIGYIAQSEQIPIIKTLISRFKERGAKIYIDPVMGDGGRRYKSISSEQCEGLKDLCQNADWIFPNRTEASILLDIPFNSLPDSKEALQRLKDRFSCNVVLTGIKPYYNSIGAALLENEKIFNVFHPFVPGSFPGTGDLFASAFIGAVLNNAGSEDALNLAEQFVFSCVKHAEGDIRFGVPFEQELPALITAFKKIKSQ